MHEHRPPRPRRNLLPWVPLLALAVLVAAPDVAQAKTWESRENNCVLIIPDAPAPWEWLPFSADWSQASIIQGARRAPAKLKDGRPATGQGALLHLVRRKADEGATLADLAASKDVRDFFLKRFAGSEGEVESEEITLASATNADGHPAIVLRAEGQSLNLRGNKGLCSGIQIVTVAKGFLYLVRMYAFPTEFDTEGLVVDLDFMEGNCLELLDTKEEDTKEPPRPPEEGGNNGGEDQPAPEEEKEVLLENRPQRWRAVKHAKLHQVEVTDDERKDDLELKFEGSDRMGGYSVYLYAIPLGRIVDGVQAKAPDLVKWLTADWWKIFNTNHPQGELATFKWPRKTSRPTFLTFPDIGDEDNKIVMFKADKKRPIEADASDMIKKFRAVEKPKKNNLGKHGKGIEAIRGIMQGKRPRYGVETVARYAWRTSTHSYRLFVSMYGEAHKKWGVPIRETLESFEFGVKFR